MAEDTHVITKVQIIPWDGGTWVAYWYDSGLNCAFPMPAAEAQKGVVRVGDREPVAKQFPARAAN